MKESSKKGIAIGLVAGLFLGFLIGAVSYEAVDKLENDSSSNGEESNDVSTYELIKFQLRERIKGYTGITDTIEKNANISENEHPENISRKIENWLPEEASCRHYAALTFTIAAEHGYENIALKTGYLTVENERRYHLWFTWENQSLEYPLIQRILKHETENIYQKEELWDEN